MYLTGRVSSLTHVTDLTCAKPSCDFPTYGARINPVSGITAWVLNCPVQTQQQFNKHFHIWAGRFAYAAGVIQCYRGLELVSSDDELIFSAGDGLDLQVTLT